MTQPATKRLVTEAKAATTYVRFVDDATGAPLPAGKVTVKVNATTHEITDIVWEA